MLCSFLTNRGIYICMGTEKKVILTGTLLRTPSPVLTKNRQIQCLLRVKMHRIYFIHNADKEKEQQTYIVRITSHLANILFMNACKGNRLTIPGLLIPGTAGIKADIAYKA